MTRSDPPSAAQRHRTTIDTVTVENDKNIRLGDLRTLLARAEDLPDDAVVIATGTTDGAHGGKYAHGIAVTIERVMKVANDSSSDHLTEGIA